MEAVGYMRCSTKGQAKRHSLIRQRTSIESFCNIHNIKLLNLYSDAISGWSSVTKRPGFTQLTDDIYDSYDPEETMVIVESWDRLSRDYAELLILACSDHKYLIFTALNEIMPPILQVSAPEVVNLIKSNKFYRTLKNND